MQDFSASEAILGGSSAFLPSGKAEEQKAVRPHSANFLRSKLPLLNFPKEAAEFLLVIIKGVCLCDEDD